LASAANKAFASGHWPQDSALVPDDANDTLLKAACLELGIGNVLNATNMYLRAKKVGDRSGSLAATHPHSSCNSPSNASRSSVSIPHFTGGPTKNMAVEASFHGMPVQPWTRLVQLLFPGPEDWPAGVVYTDIVALGLYEFERRQRGEGPLWADKHARGELPRWKVRKEPQDVLQMPKDALVMRIDGVVFRVWDVMDAQDRWEGVVDNIVQQWMDMH
jgi:hypothetical protein